MKVIANGIAAFVYLSCLVACGQESSARVDVCVSPSDDQGAIRAAHEVEVLNQPNGKQILNPRATEAFRREVFYEIDPTEAIERVCSKGGWTKVRATNLKFSGWVRDGDVEPIPHDESSLRVYQAKDVTFMDKEWSPREKALKPKLIAKFNEVSKECHELEPLVMAAPNSTDDAPRFNFTCDDGGPHFITYEPGD